MRVGLCGIGTIGRTHAALLVKQNVEFIAVADAMTKKREIAEKRYGVRTEKTIKL